MNLARGSAIPFFMSSTTGVSGVEGLLPHLSVMIRKPGGAFVTPFGVPYEIGGGWYEIAANPHDTDTNGPLLLNATASGAWAAAIAFNVIGEPVPSDLSEVIRLLQELVDRKF